MLTLDATTAVYEDDTATDAAENGDGVAVWSGGDYSFAQATAGNRPAYSTTGPGLVFDGVDDRLVYAGSLADTAGTLLIAFTTGASVAAAQVLFSSADSGTADNWFEVGITDDGRIYIESNAAGTQHTVVGSTLLAVSTGYVLAVAFDGTDYYVTLNGVEENPLMIENAGAFAWFGDVAGADNLVIGGTVTSAGLARPFGGTVHAVRVWSEDITH